MITASEIFNEINESEYEKQANNFLKITGTTLTVNFKNYGTMPAWDQEDQSRDIFNCTLKNSKHKYRFTFGQSINESTGGGDNKPTPYDVLTCLQKYEPGTFEDFCGNFGYDSDSRKAYKTYKAVMKEWKNIELLFTPEQLEMLQEIN